MKTGTTGQPDFNATYQQAVSALESGRPEIAAGIFESLLARHQGKSELLFPYAIALYQTGSIDAALKHMKVVFRQQPKNNDVAYNLGLIAREAGDFNTAEKAFFRATKITPLTPECHIMLGNILTEQNKTQAAKKSFNRAVQLDKNNVSAWYGLAMVLNKINDFTGAREAALAALKIDPSHLDARFILATTQHQFGHTQQAIENLEKILLITPDDAHVLNQLGYMLPIVGNSEMAVKHLRRAIEAEAEFSAAHYNLSQLIVFEAGGSDLEKLETAARQGAATSRPYFYHYALAKAYQDTGDHNKAFTSLQQGAVQKRKTVSYNQKHQARFFDKILNTFDEQLIAGFNRTATTHKTPIFILGMPRSGTTLIEQILASHSAVAGGGELPFLQQMAESISYPGGLKNSPVALIDEAENFYISATGQLSGNSLYFTDKTPGNFLYIGLILAIFPNAKIIHCRRDPVDTCLSCFKQLFNSGAVYSYDLDELGHYYLNYARLMDHWHTVAPGRIFNVDYETMTSDTEAQVRQLLEHCGLPYEESCLRFYQNKRTVNTASMTQVRKPIYQSSVGLWHQYEEQLKPLLEILEPVRTQSS